MASAKSAATAANFTTVSRRARDFSAAPDLFAFVSDLKPAVEAGDPEALWFTYRALEYCFAYALNPAGYTKDTETAATQFEPGLRDHFLRARTQVSGRCRGYSTRKISLSQTYAVLLTAAQEGSLAAKATAIAYANALPKAQRLPDSDLQIAQLVANIRRAKDPEAYLALSLLTGAVAQGRQNAFGPVSGSDIAAQSWALAACRIGMDCSATSPVMTQYCANAMVCGYQNLNQLALNALIPAASAKLVETNIQSITAE